MAQHATAPTPGGRSAASSRALEQVRFHSILFDRPDSGLDAGEREEPAFFHDLNLDQVVDSITSGREEYDLKPFFYVPMHDAGGVRYRHEILHDLEAEEVSRSVDSFAKRMRRMREHLALVTKLHYTYQKERWFLDAVGVYCEAVRALADELAPLEMRSRGFQGFRDFLTRYARSNRLATLADETQALKDALADVHYSLSISGKRVQVNRYEGEADYSADVEQTFARFQQGAVKDYRVKLPDSAEMTHVEARVLDLVERLYPDTFRMLDEYCVRNRNFLDRTIGAFDREVQFYLAYLEYVARFRPAGLPFCYPRVSPRSKEVWAEGAFDLALANKLAPERSAVVCNDFFLKGPERVLVVTGPNQGGKTTFARMFGQLHHLASLGLPVPGSSARLFLPDRVFSHFEREEDLETLRGKLDDELVRIHDILERATSNSVIIMNESFSSTTLTDALFIGTQVMNQILKLEALCVCVTFVDELASLSDATISMVATVVPDDPAVRTYKIVRRPADGLAYAAAIAEKYGLTYASLRRRIGR